jgi:hypothetical protein
VQSVLPSNTPVIIGGDWNEDEMINGQKGPAEWLTRAQFSGGPDGTDRDGSDMLLDTATRFFTGSNNTIGSRKYDYLAHQDSLVTRGVQTVFDSSSTPSGAFPSQMIGFPNLSGIIGISSDHLPVFVDYQMPIDCPVPSNYCTVTPNSVGTGTTLTAQGSTSIAANDFSLFTGSSPPNTFGLFFYGAAMANTPLGDGVRCVAPGGVGLFRFNPATLTGFFGESLQLVDYSAPPIPAGQITVGSTWYFQFWYRDSSGGPAGFNLSDGVEATFCP